jgi:hypothetical protein
MRNLFGSIGIVVIAALAAPAFAQTGAAVMAKGPGVGGAAQTTKVSATVTAIDAATREITLKGPEGREVTLTAGAAVKNFSQIKVGDTVSVEYIEALTLELKKGGTAMVGRTDVSGAAGAKPGERPAGMIGRKVTITAEVVGLDPKTQVVTLRGPQRTVDLKVGDPEQFKRVAMGDRVEATYTEAVAIALEPAKK